MLTPFGPREQETGGKVLSLGSYLSEEEKRLRDV
jgi:hypothetical protein